MVTIVGVFSLRGDGERAVRALAAAGFTDDRLTLLTPDTPTPVGAAVPTTEAEPPGIGRTLGGVVGGAAGATGGMQAGALVSLLVPGVGPILALGAIGAVMFGFAGAAIGGAMDRQSREGLPHDEIYVYEDALRRGRTVVIALAPDEAEAARGRALLAEAGAETIDAAREQWWLGLRDAEAAEYVAAGGDFVRDEAAYRRGFEASLSLDASFRRGFERGRAHRRAPRETRRAA